MFTNKMYVDETLEKKIPKILRKIKRRQKCGHTYVIVFNKDFNRLEYTDADIFAHKFYPKKEQLVLGIAENSENAKSLIVAIYNDMIKISEDIDVKNFILSSLVSKEYKKREYVIVDKIKDED